jgi:hypothetical protein
MNRAFIQSNGRGSVRPRILLTDTNRWPLGPRLAMGFDGMGGEISVVCPLPGHPAAKTSVVKRTFPYLPRQPLLSLKRAIETVDPDFILPLCDRSVQYLHELHSAATSSEGPDSKIASLIERSLGAPESFQTVSSRYQLLQMARSEGIRVPEMIAIGSVADLNLWRAKTAPPWVIKADGTWGGRGVRLSRNADEALRDWQDLSLRPSLLELTKRLSLNRDRGWILSDWWNYFRPNILAQSYISGRPANCAVVCWQGKLLAGIAVEVVQAQGPTEPAIVVRVVEGAEMLRAAQVLALRLKLSGFFGLDFMIEENTELPYLIEMNPRCTPPCPIPLGRGRDLVAALWAQLSNEPLNERKSVTNKTRITYFPRNGGGNDGAQAIPLDTTYYDLPEGEPQLVEELLHPWSARSLLGQILDSARKIATRDKTSTSYVFEKALEPVDPDTQSVLRR